MMIKRSDMLKLTGILRTGDLLKFRNLLVHVYWKIDDKKVYEILQKDISDLREFLEEVINYVK